MNRSSAFLFGLFIAVTACNDKRATASTASNASAALVGTAPPVSTAAPKEAVKIQRIVFVGKEHACDCTKKKIETATNGLKKILGDPPRVPILTHSIDLEPEKLETYRRLRPILAVPAIYFLNAEGGLVDMLQGEITDAQLERVLGNAT